MKARPPSGVSSTRAAPAMSNWRRPTRRSSTVSYFQRVGWPWASVAYQWRPSGETVTPWGSSVSVRRRSSEIERRIVPSRASSTWTSSVKLEVTYSRGASSLGRSGDPQAAISSRGTRAASWRGIAPARVPRGTAPPPRRLTGRAPARSVRGSCRTRTACRCRAIEAPTRRSPRGP